MIGWVEHYDYKPDARLLVAALTPSGGRPLQLGLCRKMARQQVTHAMSGGFVHVISDNPDLSIANNLVQCIDAAQRYQPDYYVVMEDDDFYPPRYLQKRVEAFLADGGSISGSAVSKYYHVPTGGYRVMHHPRRSSLCATAWCADALPLVLDVLHKNRNETFVDRALWRVCYSGTRSSITEAPTMVGVKGLGGRAGAGVGHDEKFYADHDDINTRHVLREWVGDEWAETYLRAL